MSYVTLAQQGLASVEERNWGDALDKLSTALLESPNPAWLIARSKALSGLGRPQDALDDANLAWHKACERNKRDLMASAQYRRGVAFFQLKQYANADYCHMHCMRLLKKGNPAMPKEDPGLEFVDKDGFWTVTSAEAKDAARYEDIAKKEDRLFQAMGGGLNAEKDTSHFRQWRMASTMRIQALSAMEKLPEGDAARKLTTTMIPDEKHLVIHLSSGPKVKPAKIEEPKVEAAESAEAEAPKVEAAPRAIPEEVPLRVQEFQTNYTMSVSIFSKGVDKDKLQVQFSESSVHLYPLVYPNGDEKEFQLDLWGRIIPLKSSYTVTPNKVELVLTKEGHGKWAALKHDGVSKKTHISKPQGSETSSDAVPVAAQGPAYPSSSRNGPKNWDQFEADDNSDEEKDVNRFFKRLYKDATPEQQRAMMKSFTESNGTSLSTNWDDVKDKKVETVPPDGLEAKKWE